MENEHTGSTLSHDDALAKSKLAHSSDATNLGSSSCETSSMDNSTNQEGKPSTRPSPNTSTSITHSTHATTTSSQTEHTPHNTTYTPSQAPTIIVTSSEEDEDSDEEGEGERERGATDEEAPPPRKKRCKINTLDQWVIKSPPVNMPNVSLATSPENDLEAYVKTQKEKKSKKAPKKKNLPRKNNNNNKSKKSLKGTQMKDISTDTKALYNAMMKYKEGNEKAQMQFIW